MFKHILVPTDGSELSQKAIRNVAILARENRARLTVFHARPELRMPFYDEYIRIENDMWNECARLSGEEARRYLDRLEELAGVPVDIVSTGPDREETIVLRHPFRRSA